MHMDASEAASILETSATTDLSTCQHNSFVTDSHLALLTHLTPSGHERPGWCYPTGRCAYLPSVTRYRQSIKPPPPPPPPPIHHLALTLLHKTICCVHNYFPTL